jgi:hypothetical protein
MRSTSDVRRSAAAPFTDARAAFELATGRSRSMKVQLAF